MQSQPYRTGLLLGLLHGQLVFGLGLRLRAHGFLKFGAAVTAGVQGHVQAEAHHLLALRVAGWAKVAVATQAVTAGLGHQVQRDAAAGLVLFYLVPGNIPLCFFQAQTGVGFAHLGQHLVQRRR